EHRTRRYGKKRFWLGAQNGLTDEMEKPMSRNVSTRAPHTVFFGLTALVLAVAPPQAGLAQPSSIYPQIGIVGNQMDNGAWKLKNSRVDAGNPQSGVLEMKRSAKSMATENPEELLVVSRGNVYVASGQAAKDLIAGKRVDPKRMVQVGTNVRSNDICA